MDYGLIIAKGSNVAADAAPMEKHAKVRSHLMFLHGKAYEGEESSHALAQKSVQRVTCCPCVEKHAKVSSHLMPLHGKAYEGGESPDASASFQPSRFCWTITSVVNAPTKWCSTRSDSRSQSVVTGTEAAPPTPVIAAQHRRRSNIQAVKSEESVPERVGIYSGISRWLLDVIESGYTLQFRHRPPHFNGTVSNIASKCPGSEKRGMQPARKGAVERIPPSELESGFYSRYFVVPKRDGGLCLILDLRPITRALCKRPFRMITLKQILAQIRVLSSKGFSAAART
ncbi:hypothetical protein M9458_013580, partial [Cirrhinus mrigala]